MKLYQITLPMFDNAGLNTNVARVQWEKAALQAAGGFTRLPAAEGAWLGPDGKTYTDRSRAYHIACEEWAFAGLLAEAFRLFPDQLAIFTAEIGMAIIHERPKAAA